MLEILDFLAMKWKNLRSKYKIQVEPDLYNIISMITIGDNEETLIP